MAMRLKYHAVIAPSPGPTTLTKPSSSILRDAGVGGGEFCPVRHVFGVAVAERGANDELLIRVRFENDVFGKNFNLLDARVFVFRARRAGSNPLGQHAIIDGIDFKLFAAFMRNRRRGFVRIMLRPGSLGFTRRPKAWRVNVR